MTAPDTCIYCDWNMCDVHDSRARHGGAEPMTLRRNTSTPRWRDYWRDVDHAASQAPMEETMSETKVTTEELRAAARTSVVDDEILHRAADALAERDRRIADLEQREERHLRYRTKARVWRKQLRHLQEQCAMWQRLLRRENVTISLLSAKLATAEAENARLRNLCDYHRMTDSPAHVCPDCVADAARAKERE